MGSIITVDFHGDQLLGFEDGRGTFVALKPIVEGMGLDWSSQHKRLQRDPILSERDGHDDHPFRARRVAGGRLPAARPRARVALHRRSARIAAETTRDKVVTYQRECYRVLARAFSQPAEANAARPAADPVAHDQARKLVTEARLLFGDLAGRQLWLKLGLPLVPAMAGAPVQLGFFAADAEGGL